ncbi:30S ribosomal protein S2 [archaeon]|jgi:ribosomal protein uS2|nr:30S ribosomal protein S2 [archaeon]MBT7128125.1 30S ribosomal protein S2 [archaeon]
MADKKEIIEIEKDNNLDKQEEGKPDKKEITLSVSDGDKKEDQTILTPLEDYIKTAAYLGTKVITPTMRKYVYRRRLDGLAILNTLLVDKKLAEGIDFIKQFKPGDWTLICKREAGWRGAKMFAELTGVRTYTKKYPSGVLTNTVLDDFIETKMVVICDPWLDKNALKDAKNIRIPVAAICDTNNHTADCDVVMIGNNKSNKSMGLFFWLMAREYMKAHGIDKECPSLEDFVGEKLILEEPRKKKMAREKKEQDLKSAESAIEEKMRALAEKADEEALDGMKEEEEKESVRVGEVVAEGV